jgi:adenylosuccinate synthase
VGAGKTTLAEALVEYRGFKRLLTRDAILRRLPDTPRTRLDLQAAGERLDRETGGRWVADELRGLLVGDRASPGVVVDAVLIPGQVEAVRAVAGLRVIHAHLTAPRHELEARYANKRSGIEESDRYSDLLRSATEVNVEQLSEVADLVVDTSLIPLQDEIDLVVNRLNGAAS